MKKIKPIYIIIGVLIIFFLMQGTKKTAQTCVSNEPNSLNNYKTELEKIHSYPCKIYTVEDFEPENCINCDKQIMMGCHNENTYSYRIVKLSDWYEQYETNSCSEYLNKYEDVILEQIKLGVNIYRYTEEFAQDRPDADISRFFCSNNDLFHIDANKDFVNKYFDTFYTCVEECTPSCTSWSSCSNNQQTRTCTKSDCSTYTETQDCGEETCKQRLNCEFYEECNKAEDDCRIAIWVWIGAGILILFLLFRR